MQRGKSREGHGLFRFVLLLVIIIVTVVIIIVIIVSHSPRVAGAPLACRRSHRSSSGRAEAAKDLPNVQKGESVMLMGNKDSSAQIMDRNTQEQRV